MIISYKEVFMDKDLILITGSVMNSNSDSVDTYNKLISMIDSISEGRNPGIKMGLLLTMMVSLFVSFFLSLIIHEGGHLVFGLLSGYKYLLFRIGSLTLIKRNNKYECKKFSIKIHYSPTGGRLIILLLIK